MPIIMCSATMWRFVRLWRSAQSKPRAPGGAAVLGPWAATVFSDTRRDLVLSVETRTCLTVICRFGAEGTFPAAWSTALRAALEDLAVPPDRIAAEVGARTDLRLERLTDDRFRDVLGTIEFVCDTELFFDKDVRVVQRNLNEFPHDHPPDYVPFVAVRRLFGMSA
jgi:hypothetical protein